MIAIPNMDLDVFHVGGRGGVGPIKCLFRLKNNLCLTIFEANLEGANDDSWQNYDQLIDEYASKFGIKLLMIPKCVSNTVGPRPFNINVMPDSSSLFDVSPGAKFFTRMDRGKYRIVWGEICRPQRTTKIDVTTLDALHADGTIPLPHFLSMDVQGAEYDILTAAENALRGDLMGVVTEIEFQELYDGQKLFTDQFELLKEHRFNLFDIFNTEYWHSGVIAGKGALMVGEALFLRDYRYFTDKYREPETILPRLAQLAIIALLFDRKSYAFEIMAYIFTNHKSHWLQLVRGNGAAYLKKLNLFYHQMLRHRKRMAAIPVYQDYITLHPENKPNFRSVLSFAYDLSLRTVVEKLKRLL